MLGFLLFLTWICQNRHGFLKNFTWTLQSCWVDLLKLLRGLAKHILCISPFTKQNQTEVWLRFQTSLKLLLWTKCVEWVKVFNSLRPLYLWQRLVYYKRHHLITIECCNDENIKEACLSLKSPDHNGEREMVAMTKLFGHNDLRTTNGDQRKMLVNSVFTSNQRLVKKEDISHPW